MNPSTVGIARIVSVAGMVCASACGGDVAPSSPPTLSIVAGNQQSAMAATELPGRVVVLLRDAHERPIAGARIEWTTSPTGGDVLTPIDSLTDEAGNVEARWALDTVVGMHALTVAGPGGTVAHATAFATARPYSNVTPLPLVTYEGSGQAVHPDFVRLPAGWPGDPFRLVATPYPGGNPRYENPSFFTGAPGKSWMVPEGVSNPLETPLIGYYSDPDVLYDPDANELRIYYRHVRDDNSILLIRSSDGVRWSAPVLSVRAPNHMIVSPTVVRRSAADWMMWSVNAGTDGCGGATTTVELRRSTNGVDWTNPEPTTLDDRAGFAWHIDVEWIPSRDEFWAVYPVKPSGSCQTERLDFATSVDGVHWRSYSSPLLVKGANEELRDIIYRSAIDYDATTGLVSLWYSGATFASGEHTYRWHLGFERMTLPSLFARVSVPAWEAARVGAEPSQPQLTNETAP